MMLNGRIMIVSDRRDVVAELEPLVRAGKHLAISVPNGEEALRSLERGLVPDLIITDMGSSAAVGDSEYLQRFRQINRVGAHMVVLEEGAARPVFTADPTPAVPLRRPFHGPRVELAIEEAVLRMDRELVALRSQTWREMEDMRLGMQALRRDVVTALAGTIAARDPYMAGHAHRVAELSRRVAEAMGAATDDVELLENAALLHEIGKVAIPIELLHKTDPLSPDELEQIRAHARVGAEIVRGVGSLRTAAPIIEHHNVRFSDLHHKLDPDSSEFLLAGILQVVDAYDAMTSARAYRGPMTHDYCARTLQRGSGVRFHPAATEMLLRITQEEPHPAQSAPARTA
ncbi:MAG TPA: HD domain-containing phosphohydrolase [Longimicrobium sp.]|nr:HD domain-containing phosphohydrolase [Longimicrobium sp.]